MSYYADTGNELQKDISKQNNLIYSYNRPLYTHKNKHNVQLYVILWMVPKNSYSEEENRCKISIMIYFISNSIE